MKHYTPTPEERLSALVSYIQGEERANGAPEEQLSTAARFTHEGGDTFRIWDNPSRSFTLRILTTCEALERNLPLELVFEEDGAGSRTWTVID